MPFTFKRFEALPEVMKIEPGIISDARGWFAEVYKKSDFDATGIAYNFVQDNQTRSLSKGTLRGLHFQKAPAAQGKLVRCILGEIFDVAVDIRKGSPTYSRWVSTILSAEHRGMMWVPPGFAHGILTTSDVAEIEYKVTTEFSLNHDRTIRWNDPSIGVRWPVATPILSEKDAKAPMLEDVDNNFVWSPTKRSLPL